MIFVRWYSRGSARWPFRLVRPRDRGGHPSRGAGEWPFSIRDRQRRPGHGGRTRHREWRDPEFGHRLLLLRERKAEAPNRPLVLVVGSSRVQQGIDPAAMGFEDEPGEPLVFNFGYRGASPIAAARNVFRVLDAGVRPDYVLIEFSPVSALGGSYAAVVLRKWVNRLNFDDVEWMWKSGFLNPENLATYEALLAWAGATATPWTTHRPVIMPHWLPEWVTETQWKMSGTERMDRNGFTEMQTESTTTELFRKDPAACRRRFAFPATNPVVSVKPLRSIRSVPDIFHCVSVTHSGSQCGMMTGRCVVQGVAVAPAQARRAS